MCYIRWHDMQRQDTQQIAPRIAANIKAVRGEMSQREFSKLLDVDPSYVHRWETGKVVPNFASITLIAEATGRPPEWFFADHSQAVAA